MNFLFRKNSKKIPLPKTTLPLDQEVADFQKKFLITLLFVLGGVGFYVYEKSKDYHLTNKPVEVWVAREFIAYPYKITQQDLVKKKIPRKFLPDNFIRNIDYLKERASIHDIQKNEVLLDSHLAFGVNPDSISGKFSEYLAVNIAADWLVAPWPDLDKNDLVDIQVTNISENGKNQSSTIAQNVKVLVKPTEKSLVVNLSEEESQNLLFSRGLRLPMQIIVHPKGISTSIHP